MRFLWSAVVILAVIGILSRITQRKEREVDEQISKSDDDLNSNAEE